MTTLDRFFARLTLPRALALAALLWAAIYLPVLGSLEIRGEEGRRILPAVAMLDTGDWLVPQVGGVPYYSKPPLINWLVAKAFQWTGVRNEWTARLPSVLATLAVALTAVWSLARWLGAGGGLLCAIFLLTNIGLMEKGRLIEIEAVYLSLYGIALLLWLGAWRQDIETPTAPRFSWRTWTLPYVFLGLGMLTKGPLHLIYFYAVVLGILICARRWRDLFNWAHLLGLLLMLGIFAAWAVPYFREISADQAANHWYKQMAGRAEVSEKFKLGAWLLNGPRGLVNFLPWVVLLPLAWRMREKGGSQPPGPNLDTAMVRGLCWALGVTFVVISLAPGGIPRYTLPLIVPASVLLALSFSGQATAPQRDPAGPEVVFHLPSALPLVWQRVLAVCLALAVVAAPVAPFQKGTGGWRWLTALAVITVGVYLLRRVKHLREYAEGAAPTPVPAYLPLALASGVVMALLTADYAVGMLHLLRHGENVRPVGHAVRHRVPAGQRIAVLQPGFLPFLFYIDNLAYVQTPDALPPPIHYLLVRQGDLAATDASLRGQGLTTRVLLQTRDKRIPDSDHATWLLLSLDRPGTPSL